MKPLAIDLYCGLGGWTEGLLAEGYDVVGFDIEQHAYGAQRYPAQLVLQDVRTLHGRQFKDATLIVGSSPCQEFSWRAMPWKAAKAAPPPILGIELFEAQFRIQREASEAAGHHIPMVVENVCGAQKWVGRARWHYGSYYLWGDVPALMPMTKALKVPGFRFDGSGRSFQSASVDGVKVGGLVWNKRIQGQAFNTHAERQRLDGQLRAFPNEAADAGAVRLGGSWFHEYRKGQGPRNHGSKSPRRKAASAMIAKIPPPLARHIAAVWRPAA